MMTTTAAVVAHQTGALAAAKLAVSAACRDPSDAKRALMGAVHTTYDVSYAVLNLGYAAWYRDSHYLSQSGAAAASIPGDAADTVVYGVSALVRVIPASEYLLPIGWAWGKIRGHDAPPEEKAKEVVVQLEDPEIK